MLPSDVCIASYVPALRVGSAGGTCMHVINTRIRIRDQDQMFCFSPSPPDPTLAVRSNGLTKYC